MPHRVDSSMQTHLAVSMHDGVLGGGKKVSNGKMVRRRVFVQTDTGNVLGIELQGSDNAKTVKKKMQSMLHVPAEHTALTFGDTVLKSDLSKLRNNSPLLLMRELQRSLSTPCIFPPQDALYQIDGGQPFEVVGGVKCCPKMKKIVKEIVKAIECGVEPVAVSGGLGGAYYFRNIKGDSVAIVKPTDEEPFAPNNPKGFKGKTLGQPGLKRAVRVGETGVREVAAYLLDHDHFAKVPPTVLVKVSHHVFNVNKGANVKNGNGKGCSPVSKLASCQQFVHHDYDASDHGTSRFSVSAVHRIGILDIRIFNTDRHAGNILVRTMKPSENQGAWNPSSIHANEALELIPIDHGLCLPEALEDPYFEWLHWPQASVPFLEEELDYIRRLDEYKDVDLLRAQLPMLREACFRVLIMSTMVLKKGAEMGLCLTEMGEFMTRDGMEEASQLEMLCFQAKLLAEADLSNSSVVDEDEVNSEYSFGDEDAQEQFAFEIDVEDTNTRGGCSVISRRGLLAIPRSGCSNGKLLSSRRGFADYPVLLSNSVEPTKVARSYSLPLSSPKAIRKDRKAQKSFCGALLEDEVCLPGCRLEAHGIRGSEISPALQATWRNNNSELGSPRMEWNDRERRQFCPLVEEEEVNVFSEMDSSSKMASCKLNDSSPRAKPYRSVGFREHKQRYTNHPECLGFGALALEIRGKGNAGGSSFPLSVGDMKDEEWWCFLDHFEDLLHDVFFLYSQQKKSLKQRLGISYQF